MTSKFIPLSPGVYDVEIQSLGGNCLTTTVREGLMLQSIEPVYHGGSEPRYKVKFTKAARFAQRVQPIDPLEYRIRREEMRGVPWMLAQLRYNEDSLSIRQLAYRYARSGQPHYGRTPLIEGDKKIYAILKIDRVVEERCSPLPESRVVTNKVFRFDVARAPRRAETFLSPSMSTTTRKFVAPATKRSSGRSLKFPTGTRCASCLCSPRVQAAPSVVY